MVLTRDPPFEITLYTLNLFKAARRAGLSTEKFNGAWNQAAG